MLQHTSARPVVDLVYFNAGGGHRATAQALEAVLREQQRPWTVRTVDLARMLDPEDAFRRIAGFAPESLYNQRLKRGWTLGLKHELRLLQALIRVARPWLLRRLCAHWANTAPDLVVSLVPNFNRPLRESLQAARPGVPYVTVLTDFADLPPRFWIEPGLDQHVVCGTDRAVAQARAMGHSSDHIHATSGMVVRPDFYRAKAIDRDAIRLELGLDPGRPTGIVLFGGHGSADMLTVARQVPHLQMVYACGHNEGLRRELQALPSQAPRLVLGYTEELARYLRLADFLIGKPGPGSLSEALLLELPVLVVRNAWTMPQERYNTQWVHDMGVGIVHDSFRTIGTSVAQLVANLDDLRARVRGLHNRAVFEVPEVLADILNASAPERKAYEREDARRQAFAHGLADQARALASSVPPGADGGLQA